MTIPVLSDSTEPTTAGAGTFGASSTWAAYADGVRFLALRKLHDPDAADDVAQETVFRALKAATERPGEPIRDPAAFIYGIARHIIADTARSSHKTRSFTAADSLAAPDRDYLQALISEEERHRVRVAIRDLPRAERALLEMSFVRGMTSHEIASRLGESADGVRKRKSRALQRLRKVFLGD